MQSALVFAAIVLACVSGGAAFGMWLRNILPAHHLDERTRSVVSMGTGLVATMAALVLGLLVASAKGTYDEQRGGVDSIASNLLLLDTMLAQYGTGAQDTRELVRHTVAAAIARAWPDDASQTPNVVPNAGPRSLYDAIQRLPSGDESERELRSRAMTIAIDLGRTRWLLAAHDRSSSMPAPFLVVLTFWLTVLFATFGLFAPANATASTMLFVCALSVSTAIFLIIELAEPFTGLIRISSASMRDALAQIAR